jgi:hypothetical protein
MDKTHRIGPDCKCTFNFTCRQCLNGGSIITNPEDSFGHKQAETVKKLTDKFMRDHFIISVITDKKEVKP